MAAEPTTRAFRILGARGVVHRTIELALDTSRSRRARCADATPVVEIMSHHVVCAEPTLDLRALVEVIVQERLGCVPIVEQGLHPVGMITKLDIVEQLVAPVMRVSPTVGDVMMPLAITLGVDATVAQAAALMAAEEMHHVMIVEGRDLIGIVSTMDVTRWLSEHARLRS